MKSQHENKQTRLKIKKVVKQQDSEGNEVYTLQSSSLAEDSFVLDVSNISEKTRRDSFFTSVISTISGTDNNLAQIKADFSNFEEYISYNNLEKSKFCKYSQPITQYHDKNANIKTKEEIFQGNIPLKMKENYNDNQQNCDYSKPFNKINEKIDEKIDYEKFMERKKANLSQFSENTQKNIDKENTLYNNFIKKPKKTNKSLFKSEYPCQNERIPYEINESNTNRNKRKPNNFLIPDENKKMFRSQSQTNAKTNLLGEEMKSFLLPKDIIKMNEDFEKNYENIVFHLDQQKNKINFEMDDILQEITQKIESKRKEILSIFDNYQRTFQENYEYFQKKIKFYKDKSIETASLRNIEGPMVFLNDIQYFYNKEKIKTENFASFYCFPANKINLEVLKKEIFFLSNEISKQLKHLPEFNFSPTSEWILKDSEQNIMKEIDYFFENFQKLVYETPIVDLNFISLEPKISDIVLNDSMSVLTNKQKTQMKVENMKKFETHHKKCISSLLLFDSENFITGSEDGEIKLWSLQQNNIVFKEDLFSNDFPIKNIVKFEGFEEEIQGKSNFFKRILSNTHFFKKNLIIFVIEESGESEKIKIFDIFNKKTLKKYRENQQITALVSLEDQYSFIFGDSSGQISLMAIDFDKPMQKIHENQTKINSILLMRDLERVISGSQDSKITIFRVFYKFSINYQRKIANRIEILAILDNKSPVLSMRKSFFSDFDVIIVRGEQCFRFWDINKKKIVKEIAGNEGNSNNIIVFDNLFEKKQSFFLNFGKFLQIIDGDGNSQFIDHKTDHDFNSESVYVFKKGEMIHGISNKERSIILYNIY